MSEKRSFSTQEIQYVLQHVLVDQPTIYTQLEDGSRVEVTQQEVVSAVIGRIADELGIASLEVDSKVPERLSNGPTIQVQLDGKVLAQVMVDHPEVNLLAMMREREERERERQILLDMAYRNCEE